MRFIIQTVNKQCLLDLFKAMQNSVDFDSWREKKSIEKVVYCSLEDLRTKKNSWKKGLLSCWAYNMVKKAYVDYVSDEAELREIFEGNTAFDDIIDNVEHIYEEVFEE